MPLCLCVYSKHLLACFESAALWSLVRAIIIEWYLDVRFCKFSLAWQSEFEIAYVQSSLYPLRLIVGLYAEDGARLLVKALGVIEVLSAEEQWQVVFLHYIGGVGEEEV